MDCHSTAESNARVGIVHYRYRLIDGAGAAIKATIWRSRASKDNIFWDILVNDYAMRGSASAIIVRRAVLDQIGLFDERLFYGADVDM